MSDAAGMRVCVGDFERPMPGWLCMHAREDADVPFRPGEEFPFEDRAVDALACGDFIAGLPINLLMRVMLECRRVLKPGGVLTVRVGPGSDDDARMAQIRHAAALTGLDAANNGAHAEFTKRDRRVQGEPLVSIVIPAYSPRFFAACLDSALAQTYPNLEIVVCDDSEAGEIEGMTRARTGRRDVRYLRNPVRLRGRGNFTKCLESARGEFVKFLCDDDLLAPTCVASLLNAFRRAPDITLVTSHRRRIDEYDRVLDDQPATVRIVATDSTIAGYTLANTMLMAGLNTIGEPTTVLFRKADLADAAPDYFRFNGVRGLGIIDMVTWTALLMKGDAVYLTDSLSTFRIHAAQRQHDPAMAQRNVASIRALQATWLDLGLFDLVPPHLILAKPFPPSADADWRLLPVLSPCAVRLERVN